MVPLFLSLPKPDKRNHSHCMQIWHRHCIGAGKPEFSKLNKYTNN